MHALFVNGVVWQLFASDPMLGPGHDVRDVSNVPGIAVGWLARPDGSVVAPPSTVPAVADLLTYASTHQDAVLGEVWSFNVAASGAPAHTVTTKLDARGQLAMLKVQGWLQLNSAAASTATMPYSNVDYSGTTLTFAEADALVEKAAKLDADSYATLNQVVAAIQATPPTITTFAQIDTAFAGLTAS